MESDDKLALLITSLLVRLDRKEEHVLEYMWRVVEITCVLTYRRSVQKMET